MTKGVPINPVIKNQVIHAVKNGKISVYGAAKKFNLPYNTVKNWFVVKTIAGTEKDYIAEINLLKKELDNAYRVIGELTASTSHPKGLRP